MTDLVPFHGCKSRVSFLFRYLFNCIDEAYHLSYRIYDFLAKYLDPYRFHKACHHQKGRYCWRKDTSN